MKKIIEGGKKILFVGTKKIAKTLIKNLAEKLEQPYVNERWLGGTLTNFFTIRKLLRKLTSIHVIIESNTYQNLTKREQLTIVRKKAKLEKTLKGLSTINRIPSAIFVVDIQKEKTCIKEASHLGIPLFAIIDTNSSPQPIDYPIPANDDAQSSIAIILNYIEEELQKGLKVWKEAKNRLHPSNKEAVDRNI